MAFRAGEEVQRRSSDRGCCVSMIVAGGFDLGDVLVVEEIEALGHHLQFARFAQIEALGEPQSAFHVPG